MSKTSTSQKQPRPRRQKRARRQLRGGQSAAMFGYWSGLKCRDEHKWAEKRQKRRLLLPRCSRPPLLFRANLRAVRAKMRTGIPAAAATTTFLPQPLWLFSYFIFIHGLMLRLLIANALSSLMLVYYSINSHIFHLYIYRLFASFPDCVFFKRNIYQSVDFVTLQGSGELFSSRLPR